MREPFSRANRTLRVRGGFRPMRTLRLRGNSHNPIISLQERYTFRTCGAQGLAKLQVFASHLVGSALRPRPVPPFHVFSFSRGGFFKIEWAETGLGRASSKEEAVGKNANSILSLVSFVIASGSSSPWRPSSAFASDISARATRA